MIDISWEDAKAANLANWNERVEGHLRGYAIEAFDSPSHLSSVVREDLDALLPLLPQQSLHGLDLCHLQCHIGTDTISLARAGATVTGLDFSEDALTAAAALASRSGLSDATWVHADVMDARASISGDFDVVYTSIGAINWLNDLKKWATQISALLRPGGLFYIRDGHPMMLTLDETVSPETIKYSYFNTGKAQVWDDESSYAGEAVLQNTRNYEWSHSIAEVLTSLLDVGLEIVLFDEGRTLPWQFSPRMEPVGNSWQWPEADRLNIPCTFTVAARKRR